MNVIIKFNLYLYHIMCILRVYYIIGLETCDWFCTAKLIFGNNYVVCLWMAPSASGSVLADQAKEPTFIMDLALPNVKYASFH